MVERKTNGLDINFLRDFIVIDEYIPAEYNTRMVHLLE